MNPGQVETLRNAMAIRAGNEWGRFEGLQAAPEHLEAFLRDVKFNAQGPRRTTAAVIPVPDELPSPVAAEMSTQHGFGLLMHELAKGDTELAKRIVTTSPDVTVSTNLGGWVNRRGLFAREEIADLFRTERIPSTFHWRFSPQGQHLELGIAEMNLFTMLSALGLSHEINGERLLPVGMLYDPFIERGLDAMNYACYQNARFILVATPSGISLAGEGGAHQSIATPLIGMAQDGLTSFEPAYVDELAIILRWAFAHMQEASGGSVYLRLSTRSISQFRRDLSAQAGDMLAGAYWIRRPGPNAEAVIVYTGAVAPEALEAAGLVGEDRRDVGVLAITSADRLHRGWNAAGRAREGGDDRAISHIERLLAAIPRHCGLVTMQDGHPAGLSWLGSVLGHRTRALGMSRFGQTGTIAQLYSEAGLDAQSVVRAVQEVAPGRPIRHSIAV